MKQFLFLLSFMLIGYNLYSQSRINVLPRFPRNEIKIDSGSIRIFYAMNATDINDMKTYDDLQCLDIGSKLSKYYSFYIFRDDSLKKEYIKKNPTAQSLPMFLGEFGKKGFNWSLVIWSDFFKDFSVNTLTEYAIMPRGIPHSYYSEEMPVQEWEIHDDTLTVCGYLCQKATCRFRGNDFIAWFAPELPISNGPWKFGGLPGLILKIVDNEKHYDFECIKIESHIKNFPIFKHDDKYFQKTERKKLRQLDKAIYEDYYSIAGIVITDGNNVPIPGKKFEPIPYHPLEIE